MHTLRSCDKDSNPNPGAAGSHRLESKTVHVYHLYTISSMIKYPQPQQSLSELNFVSLNITHLTVACMWQKWCQSAEVPHSVIAESLRALRRADLGAFRTMGKLGSLFGLLCYISCALVL